MATTTQLDNSDSSAVKSQAVNGLGWDVQEMPKVTPEGETPKGWAFVSAEYASFQASRAMLLRMKPDDSVDRRVYERLAPPRKVA